MNVAFIQCPVWGTYDPPFSIAQLSSCLKEHGHKVCIFDLNISLYHNRKENCKNMWAWEQSDFWYKPSCVENFFSDNEIMITRYIDDIIQSDAQIICFSMSSSSRIASLKLAKLLKEKNKDPVIIAGGTLFYDKKWITPVLQEEYIDIVVQREGEVALCELANLIQTKQDIMPCKGIVYKINSRIIDTGEREFIQNLDALPFLDFSGLPLIHYDDARHIVMMTSRGCIMQCVFCSSRQFWPGYRAMSGERIFEEVKFHKEKYKDLGHVDFLDLVFNGNMETLNAFCDLMIKERFSDPIYWTANVIIRPEMTPDILHKMKKAGCEHLIYGIESGSQRILDRMRKRYNIAVADRVIEASHKAGIITTANFMFGFPGEREEDFQETLEFIRRNAKYLTRVYPSRTFCAIEEFSYLAEHPDEFDIKPNPPNHLYWESLDGKNAYPERLRKCEAFCALASSLKIQVGCGVQTSVELDRWFNLGHYYESKGDITQALGCFLKYYQLDNKNEVILSKIEHYKGRAALVKQENNERGAVPENVLLNNHSSGLEQRKAESPCP